LTRKSITDVDLRAPSMEATVRRKGFATAPISYKGIGARKVDAGIAK
jgi:hypothetical protein